MVAFCKSIVNLASSSYMRRSSLLPLVHQEQELPRLIRGQVHRCVGNYDRGRDVLVCVSVRPGLPSELRNVHETIKACDAEMRGLVKSLNEIWARVGLFQPHKTDGKTVYCHIDTVTHVIVSQWCLSCGLSSWPVRGDVCPPANKVQLYVNGWCFCISLL